MIIINKDCIDVMKDMEDNSFHLICDVPYLGTITDKNYEKEFLKNVKELKRIKK